MTYEVYEFQSPVIDRERRVSFSRNALVRTNDIAWISKFGKCAKKRTDVADDVPMTVVDCPVDKEASTKPVIDKKPEKVEVSVKAKPTKSRKASAKKSLSKPTVARNSKSSTDTVEDNSAESSSDSD